jgi:hypothetical protein
MVNDFTIQQLERNWKDQLSNPVSNPAFWFTRASRPVVQSPRLQPLHYENLV